MPPKKADKGKKKQKTKGGGSSAHDAFQKYLQEIHFIGPQDRERLGNEHRKTIRQVFAVCQGDREGLCDVRELGNIIRTLGLNPSVAQTQMIQPLVVDETGSNVLLSKLEPLMVELLHTHELKVPVPQPDGSIAYSTQLIFRHTEDAVQSAFDKIWEAHGRKIDQDKQKYIEADQLRALLTKQGTAEAYDDNEVTEFLNAAADPDTGFIKEDLFSLLAMD